VNRVPGLEHTLRESTPVVLAAVVRRFGDFDGGEDAVQEALLAAATQWPTQGTPENPVGWLIHVASRRMTDRIRGEQARRRREDLSAAEGLPGQTATTNDPVIDGRDASDDTLTLMFMCTHPSLTPSSAIALTLRAVGGLGTAEIARAFLVPEATMAQRISRAKHTIRTSGASFAMPSPDEWDERLRSVMRVLYLIFNEGYLTSSGPELTRGELSREAIRLTRAARQALPEDPELGGLLALMLLTEARRPARTDAHGELIPLDEQNRALWSEDLIEQGLVLSAEALRRGAVGEYQLQAAVAAAHDRSPRPEDTDWREILGLYELLERVTSNPMVSLNRAIAAAMVDGPETGLDLLDALDESLAGHHRLHAARAHLLEMAGESASARAEYEIAAERTTSLPEQRYLTTQAARLNVDP